MKILNAYRIEYFLVETDDEDYDTYRRNVNGNKDSWEVLMGESWESTYDNDELEDLFQECLKYNAI
tara:strand:- start:586 stop:783 length:198 start_codon:yes stop_codon:yes gene_type:complete